MVDYIADYLDNIRSRPVFPDVSPGYMRKLVPECAPEEGEAWDDIFKDIERVIMPGVSTPTWCEGPMGMGAGGSCPSLGPTKNVMYQPL